jgi:hypothetical protein
MKIGLSWPLSISNALPFGSDMAFGNPFVEEARHC